MADTYIDSHSRRRFSDSGKSVSKWVAEKKVGGKIYEGYEVHHKNEDKLDNDPDNLAVIKKEFHHRIHRY